MIQALKQYMHYVNCIYIDSETHYCMILILYEPPKQHVTHSYTDTVYQEIHSNYVFHKQIHILINETCRNIKGTSLWNWISLTLMDSN